MTNEHPLVVEHLAPDHVCARVRGEIDLANAGQVLDDVRRAARRMRALTIDLTEVSYFDSQGARMLQHFADVHAAGSLEVEVRVLRASMPYDIIRLTAMDRVVPVIIVG